MMLKKLIKYNVMKYITYINKQDNISILIILYLQKYYKILKLIIQFYKLRNYYKFININYNKDILYIYNAIFFMFI